MTDFNAWGIDEGVGMLTGVEGCKDISRCNGVDRCIHIASWPRTIVIDLRRTDNIVDRCNGVDGCKDISNMMAI
jgi:hypothetical protein